MNLKIRLAFLYSLSVFIILVASALSIYLLNDSFRREEFYKRLVSEAEEAIKIYSDKADDDSAIIAAINQNAANSLGQQRILIFDSTYRILFASPGNSSTIIPKPLFLEAKRKQLVKIKEGNREAVIHFAEHRNRSYYFFVSAYDQYGVRKRDNLKILLFCSVLGGIVLSSFLAFFYVRHAMRPLEKLKDQMEKIDEKNLKERVSVVGNNDEVTQIARKFNAMLDRLEQAFEQRKNFVQHASHELRTPLANMLSQTESALNKTLTAEEYRQVLLSLKEDQQDLIDLTNSLLTLSRYEKITEAIDWTPIRIDDVLYQTVEFVNEVWPNAMVTIDFETLPENEDDLTIPGNESLIRSAIQNLVKNAIQYSDDLRVKIAITAANTGVTLKFDNAGKHLSKEEQARLFIPFFRGENSQNKKGYGLGLSIVQRIINVHKGRISYTPIGANINRFTIFLPGR